MGTTSLMETMTLSSIAKAHAYCIFATLRSKMLHCNTKRPGRVSCKTKLIFQPPGYIIMVEMEIQLQPFLSVPHPPAISLLNTQFTHHLCPTTVNHQHVLNTQCLIYLTTVTHQHVLNTQFLTYHACLTTLNRQHVQNSQATKVAMQTPVKPSQSLQKTIQTQQHQTMSYRVEYQSMCIRQSTPQKLHE